MIACAMFPAPRLLDPQIVCLLSKSPRSLKTISQPCAFVQQMPSRPFGMSGIVPGRFILPLVASFYIIICTWHSLAC